MVQPTQSQAVGFPDDRVWWSRSMLDSAMTADVYKS